MNLDCFSTQAKQPFWCLWVSKMSLHRISDLGKDCWSASNGPAACINGEIALYRYILHVGTLSILFQPYVTVAVVQAGIVPLQTDVCAPRDTLATTAQWVSNNASKSSGVAAIQSLSVWLGMTMMMMMISYM